MKIRPSRKLVILTSVATLGSAAALPATAVTLDIFGIPGINGTNGVGAPGTDGGPGGAANATTPPNRDPSNTSNATGGTGGNGAPVTLPLREAMEELAATPVLSRPRIQPILLVSEWPPQLVQVEQAVPVAMAVA